MKRATKWKNYKLTGGPWGCEYAVLPEETMVFSVRGYRGRYRLGRWEDV